MNIVYFKLKIFLNNMQGSDDIILLSNTYF